MNRPLLCLCAIVKDEAHAIGRTVASAKGVVDRAVFLDTGSTDGTIDTIAASCAEAQIDFAVHAGEFIDYAQARNLALDVAEKKVDVLLRGSSFAESPLPTWLLSLSADEVVEGGDHLRNFLSSYDGNEDALLVEVRTPTGTFPYPRVLRRGSPWRYVGAIHEEPRCATDPNRAPAVQIPGCRIVYSPSDPERHAQRLQERDLPLLLQKLRSGEKGEARARTLVLLGRTREHLAMVAGEAGKRDDASQEWFSALGFYALCTSDETLPQPARDHAWFKFLNVSENAGIYESDEMVKRLRPTLEKHPKDPATAFMLACHVAKVNVREGLQAAYRAARVAREAVADPDHPHDPHGLLWRTQHLAAACAKALGHRPAMHKAAEEGLAVGGPQEMFTEFLDNA